MAHRFPSESWLKDLETVLNTDARYAEVARNWEGDLLFVVEEADHPTSNGKVIYYLDLWHGKCRQAGDFSAAPADQLPKATFTLRSSRAQFLKILSGDLDPMQAMLTRRLRVDGNMAYMLRNVPVVLDFVRCARLVPIAE